MGPDNVRRRVKRFTSNSFCFQGSEIALPMEKIYAIAVGPNSDLDSYIVTGGDIRQDPTDQPLLLSTGAPLIGPFDGRDAGGGQLKIVPAMVLPAQPGVPLPKADILVYLEKMPRLLPTTRAKKTMIQQFTTLSGIALAVDCSFPIIGRKRYTITIDTASLGVASAAGISLFLKKAFWNADYSGAFLGQGTVTNIPPTSIDGNQVIFDDIWLHNLYYTKYLNPFGSADYLRITFTTGVPVGVKTINVICESWDS